MRPRRRRRWIVEELLVAEQPLTLTDSSHDKRRPAAGSAVV
jgi:hypothetical protein